MMKADIETKVADIQAGMRMTRGMVLSAMRGIERAVADAKSALRDLKQLPWK